MNTRYLAFFLNFFCLVAVSTGAAMPPPPPPPPAAVPAEEITDEFEQDSLSEDEQDFQEDSSEESEPVDVPEPPPAPEPVEPEPVEPEPVTGSVDPEMPAVPNLTEEDSLARDTGGVTVGEQAAPVKPLFANMKGKELFAQSEEDERVVRETVQRIEEVKSKQLREVYLPLDKELDAFYQEVGMVRGAAKGNLAQIREKLWGDLERGAANVSDELQKNMDQKLAKMDELESLFSKLIERENEVVKLMHELSTTVSDAFDQAAQMYARRVELQGVANETAAQQLYEKISNVDDDIRSIEDGLSAESGVVARLAKVATDARAQVAVVKSALEGLKLLDIDVAQQAIQFSSDDTTTVSRVDDAAESPQEKPERALVRMAKGTSLEEPARKTDELLVRTWGVLEPVRKVTYLVFAGIRDFGRLIGREVFGMDSVKKGSSKALVSADDMTWGDLAKSFVRKFSLFVQYGLEKIGSWWSGEELPISPQVKNKKKSEPAPVESTSAVAAEEALAESAEGTSAEKKEDDNPASSSEGMLLESGEIVVGGDEATEDTDAQVAQIRAQAAEDAAAAAAQVKADSMLSQEEHAEMLELAAQTTATAKNITTLK